ncbi:MAG TPA: flagellar hook-basal body complex protein FliE [Bryobacteraceae bacterium]|nr:flagellar hook-basal body complex protein FliE [Bryobacteraceae bacterium]
MTLPISTSLPPIQSIPSIKPPSIEPSSSGEFQSMFANAINNVESLGKDADTKIGNFLAGEGEELHNVIISTQKADLSFELFQQVRNKVVQAYQEVMRMQM